MFTSLFKHAICMHTILVTEVIEDALAAMDELLADGEDQQK